MIDCESESEPVACNAAGRRPVPHGARWLDGFAICASSLCMVHCLGLPILFALLPVLAARIDPGESFHLLMLALATPTSLFALAQGWRRGGPVSLFVLGIAGLGAMATGGLLVHGAVAEAVWTVAGSAILASAHWMNWRRMTRRH